MFNSSVSNSFLAEEEKNDGVVTMELPYLMRLVEKSQFDTIIPRAFFLSFLLYSTADFFKTWLNAIRCGGVPNAWRVFTHLCQTSGR
jgi:hypothetical protein